MAYKKYIQRFSYSDYQKPPCIPFEYLKEYEKEKIRKKAEQAAKDFIKKNLKYLRAKHPNCWIDCEHDLLGCAVYAYTKY